MRKRFFIPVVLSSVVISLFLYAVSSSSKITRYSVSKNKIESDDEKQENIAGDFIFEIAIHPDGSTIATLRLIHIPWDVLLKPGFAILSRTTGRITLRNIDDPEKITLVTKCDVSTRSLVFSPSGKYLAWLDGKNEVTLWNLRQNEIEKILKIHTKDVKRFVTMNTVTFSPSGKYLAAMSGKSVYLWEVKTGNIVDVLRNSHDELMGLAFSPDGKTIVTGGKKVILWEKKKNKYLQKRTLIDFKEEWKKRERTWADKWSSFESSGERAWNLHWSSDGRYLASNGGRGYYRIWDMKNGKLVPAFDANMAIMSITFSPDGKYVAAVGVNRITPEGIEKKEGIIFEIEGSPPKKNEEFVKIWDLETLAFVGEFYTFSWTPFSWTSCLKFTPDSKKILVNYADDIKVWNLNDLIKRHPLKQKKNRDN